MIVLMSNEPRTLAGAGETNARLHGRKGRGVAAYLLREIARPLAAPSARLVKRTLLPLLIRPAAGRKLASPSTVRVVGWLSSSTGLGNSARLCANALDEAGYTVFADNVSRFFFSDDNLSFNGRTDAPRPFAGISIYHLNPPMLATGILASGLRSYRSSFNVGFWAWELERLPSEWIAALRLVDALFVPSFFTKSAIEKHTTKPIIVVPHPVALRHAPRGEKARYGLADQTFVVSSVFSFSSAFERKNPLACVTAFKRAFGSSPTAQLILKTTQARNYPAQYRALIDCIANAPNIRILDAVWPDAEIIGLIASSDAYVSLHRSEGFGLTIAEAILAGTPAIATNWSGNIDFCHPESTALIDCAFTPVQAAHNGAFDIAGAVWADPNIDAAAIWLRRFRDDERLRLDMAKAARSHLSRYLGQHSYAAAIGRLAVDRLGVPRPPAA
ncbi:MAG: glycosyl transferase group 1 [Rhodospirillales bacterium]|nr:glycosyl transferase group 1 [Rhodospirillales bacterium]